MISIIVTRWPYNRGLYGHNGRCGYTEFRGKITERHRLTSESIEVSKEEMRQDNHKNKNKTTAENGANDTNKKQNMSTRMVSHTLPVRECLQISSD